MEPCIRATFGLALDEALGLQVIFSVGAARAGSPVSLMAGNIHRIERLIKKSEATMGLYSRVVRVEAGSQHLFVVSVGSNEVGAVPESIMFDDVIVAGNTLPEIIQSNPRTSRITGITSYRTRFSSTSPLDAMS